MRVTVTDANIFIDLIKLDLITHLFAIELEIFTTAEVLEELNDEQVALMRQFERDGLLVVKLLSETERNAVSQLKAQAGLSYTDRTVIVLAESLDALLLTGDGKVRKYCLAQRKEVRGIIWLFDRFLELQCIDHALAVEKMEGLMRINNRLPLEECLERLGRWRKLLL